MYLHGYYVPSGYMGRVFGRYMLFATEKEYRAYYKEKRSISKRRAGHDSYRRGDQKKTR